MALGEEGGEGLLTIGDSGVSVFEGGEGARGSFFVTEDLAESFDEFGEFGILLI